MLGAVSVLAFFKAGRIGVTRECFALARPGKGGLGVAAAAAAAVAHLVRGSAGTTRLSSSKAPIGGPQEKPKNAATPFCADPATFERFTRPKAGVTSAFMETGVLLKDDCRRAEKAKGRVESAEVFERSVV